MTCAITAGNRGTSGAPGLCRPT
ncbi:hypothetical protein HU200_044122 [Digitaria exilis]|uniref:Uncharacterized protein n=1 Tax=Digitaria exilis TaxID=1010633 RepID=A0A835ED83_9POAL|nr:hypothetical protein HU200_044122 [Digitaria exilis]